jgi:AcrR family transcriptional regulator
MPRLVDHEQRRRELTDATRRVVAEQGLDATTFRSVSAEAGVSVRLFQYYFGDKAELLNQTLNAVIMDARTRFAEQLEALSPDAYERSRVLQILQSLIPDTHEKLRDAIVLLAFHAGSVTTRAISVERTTAPMTALETLLTGYLSRDRGTLQDDDDAIDARMLSTSVAGIVQAVVAAHISPHEAHQLVERLVSKTMRPSTSQP